ncbi:histamine H2 receptor-like [Ptychodera flava]|uniref:histamine H2 receptor-like n=1 Tax=Ptychodera flava TaxID=63121 RepID=UPI00396A8AE5
METVRPKNNLTDVWNDSALDGLPSQLDAGGIVFACALGISMPLIIAANILTVVALIKVQISKAKRVVAPYFALSLAVSDLCIGAFLLPSNLVMMLAHMGDSGDIFCGFHGYLSVALFTTTLSNIVIISIDRYICVLQPIKYKSMVKPRRAVYMVIFAWSYGLLCAAIPFASRTGYRYSSALRACFLDLGDGRSKPMPIVLFIINFSLPLTIILFTNLKIFRTARIRSRRIADWQVNDPKSRHISPPSPGPQVFAISGQNFNLTQNNDAKNLEPTLQVPSSRPPTNISLEKRLTRAILLIVTVLIFLVTPYHLLMTTFTIIGFDPNTLLPSDVILIRVFSWMIYFNSLVNAGIYSYINTNFRRRLKQIACGKNSTERLTLAKKQNANAVNSTPPQQNNIANNIPEENSLNSDIFGQFSQVVSRHTPTESLLATFTRSSASESSPGPSELCKRRRENRKERVLKKQLSEILLPTHSKEEGEPSRRSRSAWISSESNLRRDSMRKAKNNGTRVKSKRFRELEREMRKLETQFSSATSSHHKPTD